VAGEDVFLPVERKVVRALADHDVREKAGAGQALFHRLFGLAGERRRAVAVLVRAGALETDVLDDVKGRGNVFELLAFLLADATARGAAFGAFQRVARKFALDPAAGKRGGKRVAAVAWPATETGTKTFSTERSGGRSAAPADPSPPPRSRRQQ
jgi:hypothetical protein